MSSSPKQTHVVHNSKASCWEVKHEHQDACARFETKDEAEKYGRELSRKMKTEFYIHNMDGRIGEKDSHGNDPRDVRG